jgi:hypothetical protein
MRTPARWSGARIPEEARDVSVLYNIHTVSGAHSASYKVRTLVLSQDKPPGPVLNTHFHLSRSSRSSGAVRLPSLLRDVDRNCTFRQELYFHLPLLPRFSDPYSKSGCGIYSWNI